MRLNPEGKKKRTDNWFTPPEIIKSLGVFDLDPCTAVRRPWDTALNHYTKVDNGLVKNWFGRVWMNPPYSDVAPWLKKLSIYKNGIALVFARTDINAYNDWVFKQADSIFFFHGRIFFYDIFGRRAAHNSGAPSILISYNEENSDSIDRAGLPGNLVTLRNFTVIAIKSESNKIWRVVVGEAMEELTSAHVQDIYKLVIKMSPTKVAKNKHYKEKVRQTLQRYHESIGQGKWKY